MSDLFSINFQLEPLAAKMRPRDLSEFIGQQHILGKGKILRTAIEQGHLHSMILWGPPGTGKTTLAYLIATTANAEVVMLSAVTSGIKEIRQLVDTAKHNLIHGKGTIVFIDEIHRFNKTQQDAFLPHVESGLLTLIGATTENPSFELNKALLSRAKVYVLKALQTEDIRTIIDRALLDTERGYANKLNFPEPLRDQLASFVDGDARSALNLLELVAELADENTITEDTLKEILSTGTRRFDKRGEYFYDQISALHKAVRGSAPDAALYWFTSMIDNGVDPLYIARRVVRMATEDIGLADPRALEIALSAWDVQERLGSPEGELAVAQAIIYLSVAAKSNAAYVAYNQALAAVRQYGSQEVPLHLRNAPTKLMKELGYGKAYRYAHDEPEAYAAGENYFPENMPMLKFYKPTKRGLESKISEKLAHLQQLDKQTKEK
jgi:putative ATPase